jgi:hypothetical protein
MGCRAERREEKSFYIAFQAAEDFVCGPKLSSLLLAELKREMLEN